MDHIYIFYMTYIKALFAPNYNIIFINHKFSKKNINTAKKWKFIFMHIYTTHKKKDFIISRNECIQTLHVGTYYYIIWLSKKYFR